MVEPRSYASTYAILKQLQTGLTKLFRDCAGLLGDSFDLEYMKAREAPGMLTAATIYAALGVALRLLEPDGLQDPRFARFVTMDDELLPEALVAASKSLSAAQSAAETKRIRDNLPALRDAALVWETNNFTQRLSASKNRLPRTDRWLDQVRWFPDDRFSEWHGRAVAFFLMTECLWGALDFPEILVLGETDLRRAKASLDALAMVAVGEKQLSGFLECYATSRASADD